MHWVTSSLLPDTLTDLSLEPGTGEEGEVRVILVELVQGGADIELNLKVSLETE